MLDIGSWEFLIVLVIALIVIGPKDLPALVRNVSMWIRRAKDLAREFQSGLEDMAREAELDKMTEEFKTELDPDGLMESVKQDVEKTFDSDHSDHIVRGLMENDHGSQDYAPYGFQTGDQTEVEDNSIRHPEKRADPSRSQPTETAAATDDGVEPAKPDT